MMYDWCGSSRGIREPERQRGIQRQRVPERATEGDRDRESQSERERGREGDRDRESYQHDAGLVWVLEGHQRARERERQRETERVTNMMYDPCGSSRGISVFGSPGLGFRVWGSGFRV